MKNFIVIDVESIPNYNYRTLSPLGKKLWTKKAGQLLKTEEELSEQKLIDMYDEEAGLYPEFAQIVCISVGYFDKEFTMRSFVGSEEARTLGQFKNYLDSTSKEFPPHAPLQVIGHNIKGFDIPMICKRMAFYDMKIPKVINSSGKKPWEMEHIKDTMDMWRFGGRGYISLEALCYHFRVPSPKGEVDGSKVAALAEDHKFSRIAEYCEDDVEATYKVYKKLKSVLGIT